MAAAAAAVLLQAQDESRAAAAKPVNEPQHLVLPGGTRLPLLGLGTFQLQSADAVRKALEREFVWVGSGSDFSLNGATVGLTTCQLQSADAVRNAHGREREPHKTGSQIHRSEHTRSEHTGASCQLVLVDWTVGQGPSLTWSVCPVCPALQWATATSTAPRSVSGLLCLLCLQCLRHACHAVPCHAVPPCRLLFAASPAGRLPPGSLPYHRAYRAPPPPGHLN